MAASRPNSTPQRRLTTYGKSSRSVDYSGLPQASLPQPKTPDLSQRLDSKRAVQSTTKSETVASESRRLPQVQRGRLLRSPRSRDSLSIKKLERVDSVYDIQSSDDEQHTETEPWRKRRRIDGLQAERSPRKLGKSVSDITLTEKNTSGNISVLRRSISGNGIKRRSRERGFRDIQRSSASGRSDLGTTVSLGETTQDDLLQSMSTPNLVTASAVHSHSSRYETPLASSRNLGDSEGIQSSPFESKHKLQSRRPATSPTRSHKSKLVNQTCFRPKPLLPSQRSEQTDTPRRRVVDRLNTKNPNQSMPLDFEPSEERTGKNRSSSQETDDSLELVSVPEPTVQAVPRAGNHDIKGQPPYLSPSSQTGGPKLTYARQRSFLSESNMPEATQKSQSTPISPAGAFSRDPRMDGESLSSTKRSLFALDHDGDDDNSGNATVRNIYELRRAGINARFEGAVDSIFEEVEISPDSVSAQRRCLVKLCTRLTEDQFVRRFVDNSLEKRLAKCNLNLTDIVCQYLAVSMYGLLLATGPVSSATLYTCCAEILRNSGKLLAEEDDILDIANAKCKRLSKAERTELEGALLKLRESKIWIHKDHDRTSPQIMALRCMEMAIRRVREAGDTLDIMSDSVLSELVTILSKYSLSSQVGAAEPNMNYILELAFSILESYTIAPGTLDEGKEKILKNLRLGSHLSRLSSDSALCDRQTQILILEIRLILNLTNNNPTLCEDFSTPELIQALLEIALSKFGMVSDDPSPDRKDSVLDTVILALGALINLTEWSATSRKLVLKSGFLDRLLQAFKEGRQVTSEAHSVVQTQSNVAFGYISVLLSTLSLDDDVRSGLKGALPGKNLHTLFATVEEFLQYHRKVEEELQDESMVGFTSRLQGVLNRIKRAEMA
ncbi:hypothetical protein AJ80_05050 [Polytolypa hystricis UAMH7299]|uniref:Wings apart-like protein C-terminal domain-containing protein n=1 Tax=Polytolypa hystricis (strain UAMH7299) TaxID=1447883 RepID=A0A2B7Y5Y9_POLH7|nr:hypothetical protein AJ80_05050 [Polytolypa hystricis UAMH7299]